MRVAGPTDDQLKEHYWDENLSLAQIASVYDKSVTWVVKRFKKAGIPTRSSHQGVIARLGSIVGKSFGHLTVIEEPPMRRGLCVCKCDCGNTINVPLGSLRCGGRKSCGHTWRKNYEEMPGEYLYMIKYQAKARGLEFIVTPSLLWHKFLQQGKKCALSGLPIDFEKGKRTASLDRIDSICGYTLENVQWVHKDVNRMKMDMSEARFKQIVKAIAETLGLVISTSSVELHVTPCSPLVTQAPSVQFPGCPSTVYS